VSWEFRSGRFILPYRRGDLSVALSPPSAVANGICSLETHGFQHSVFDLVAFLQGKTTVFPTPFPDLQSNLVPPPPREDKLYVQATERSPLQFIIYHSPFIIYFSTPSGKSLTPLNLSNVGVEGNLLQSSSKGRINRMYHMF
jgi:hypothetical protein